MAQAKVAIRLGTEGKEQLVRDFKDVGDAGDAAANRAAKAFERASQDMESAARRQAAAQAKIAALMPTGQARIVSSEPAGPSTAMFTAARREQALLEQQALALRAAIDPAWAAQQRFNVEMGAARTLVAANVITLDEYCAKLRIEQAALDAVGDQHARVNAASGATRAGMQQLSFQLNDMATMWAMNASPMQIFTSQAGQVSGAIGVMSGGAKGFIGFLGGPWGMAITTGVVVLGTLAAKAMDTSDALDQVKFASSAMGDAQSILGGVLDLTTGKVTTQSAALQGLAQAQLTVARVQAQVRQATARSDALEAGKLGVIGGMFASNKEVMGSSITQQITSSVMAGAATTKNAIKMLEDLNKQGMITDQVFAKAASSIANFAVEGENIKVYEDAQSALATGKLGAFHKAGPKGPRANSGKPDAGREAEQRERAMREWLYESGQNVGKGAIEALNKEGEALANNQRMMAQMRADTAAGTILLNLEWELRGKSRDVIQDALDLRRRQLDIERQFPQATADFVAEQVAAYKAQQRQAAATREFGRAWEEVERIGGQALDRLMDPTGWKNFGDVGKAVLRDLAMEMWKLSVIDPLKGALFGSKGKGGGLIGDLVKGLIGAAGKSGGDPGAAIGHEYTPAGAMLVGENGPEKVIMPRGAKVLTASDTRREMSRGSPVSVHIPISIDATGADAAGLARVEAKLAQMQSDLPGTIVSTVSEAQSRLMLRGGF